LRPRAGSVSPEGNAVLIKGGTNDIFVDHRARIVSPMSTRRFGVPL
jgi:hypothetical protein